MVFWKSISVPRPGRLSKKAKSQPGKPQVSPIKAGGLRPTATPSTSAAKSKSSVTVTKAPATPLTAVKIRSQYGGLVDEDEDATHSECSDGNIQAGPIAIKVERNPEVPTPQPRRKTSQKVSARDLPGNIRSLWSTKFIPTLRVFIAHHKSDNPFVATSPAQIIQKVFAKVYPGIPKAEVSKILPGTPIHKLAWQSTWNFHTVFRTASKTVVKGFFSDEAEFPDSESIKAWVKKHVPRNPTVSTPNSYHWRSYEDDQPKTGRYEHPVVLLTLSLALLRYTKNVPRESWLDSKFPYAAIALTLCALERAFNLYRSTGELDLKLNTDKKNAFSEKRWSSTAISYMQALKKLDSKKLERIVAGAQEYVTRLSLNDDPGDDSDGSGSELDNNGVDGRACVEESDPEVDEGNADSGNNVGVGNGDDANDGLEYRDD
ncbi:hypothetical protein BDN72DRAFT_906545 [Pluteus cervinus]|uniref:Uncharacterized protein n=1 Tax=Pluteus cervinus TaxID=181527 RepID=A0ACD2ZYZ1_9AGAR|nr:hypothetical protein BDN72DRAFT_906545 [Pluteus cervinus]